MNYFLEFKYLKLYILLSVSLCSNKLISQCFNGNLEENNFNNWSLSSGPRGNPNVSLNDQVNGYNSSVHNITNVGFDPVVGGSLLPMVGEGLHSLKIGNSIAADKKADRASYTFMVTAANADFGFKYAMVLQDGDHNLNENPFFSWNIVKGSNPNQLLNTSTFPHSINYITGNQVIADKTNPFFKTAQNSTLYRDWSFVCYDLTPYIGQVVTISFMSADCVFGGHFGYIYIDGLCSPNNPTADFNIKSQFCISEQISLDASACTNEDSYFVSIQEADQWWSPTGPEYSKWFVAQQAGIVDLKALLESLGGKFNCNKYYRINLAVTNNCEQWVSKCKLIKIVCPQIIEIPDITKCCNSSGQIVNIGPVTPGTENSYVSWSITSGSGYFSPTPNSNTASVNVFGNTTVQYTTTIDILTVPKPSQCSVTSSVNINIIDDFTISIIEEKINCCQTKLKLNIDFQDGCNKWNEYSQEQQNSFLNSLEIQWSNGSNSSEIIVSGLSQTYTVNVSLPDCFSHSATYNYIQSPLAFPTTEYTVQLSASNAIEMNSSNPLHSNMFIIASYVDATGQNYFPPVGTTQGIYRAEKIMIRVWNRWGEIIREIWFNDCGSLYQGDIRWDGTDENGNDFQEGTYVFQIYVQKCGDPEPRLLCDPEIASYFYSPTGACIEYCWGHIPGRPWWVFGKYCCSRSTAECAFRVTLFYD